MDFSLELRGITKRFGPVTACDSVDLRLAGGSIHGLIGENGAGKSTLMKVLLGVVRADTGDLLIDGRSVTIRDPREAASLGIAMVHQHFSLVDALLAWENCALLGRGAIDKNAIVEEMSEIGERFGLPVDPEARVEDLSVGERQRLEIIRCLRTNPRLLVLDEPTAVLTRPETMHLFNVLHDIVQAGDRAVVFISHKLDEILAVTDDLTVMRAGRVVARRPTREADLGVLAQEMVGRNVSLRTAGLGHLEVKNREHGDEDEAPSLVCGDARVSLHPKEAALSIEDAVVCSVGNRTLLDGLSLSVDSGEIVGIAGVEGNGQVAIEALLSSLMHLDSGSVRVDGAEVHTGRPGALRRAGVAVIPQDRHAAGCILEMTIAENLVLGALDWVAPHGFIDRRRTRAYAEDLMGRFSISAPSPDLPLGLLSGGNQQKVVVAREVSSFPRVLVAAQPTRGLDVLSAEYMYDQLRAAAKAGVGVLLITTELEEMLAVCDRINVINRGRIIGEMSGRDVDIETLGLMMGGQSV